MKKLTTLTFVITAFLFGAIAINANPSNKTNKKGISQTQSANKGYYGNGNGKNYPIGYRKGHYNKRGVYVYFKDKRVWKHGKLYKNIYKIQVFKNGRKQVKLVNSIPIRTQFGKRVTYKTKIVKKGRKTYRITYKIVKFRNGSIKKTIVKKQAIHNRHNP